MRVREIVIFTLITAAVTTYVFAATPDVPATSFVEYVVVAADNHGNQLSYTGQKFMGKDKCDAAIGNLNVVLSMLADPKTKKVTDIPKSTGDAELTDGTIKLLIALMQKYGAPPLMTLHCEVADSNGA